MADKIPVTPEQENAYSRIEVEIPNFVYANAAIDTEVDIETITLTPGTWVLGYDITMAYRNLSGGNLVMSSRVQYTDNSNNPIAKTRGWTTTSSLVNADIMYLPISRQTEIVVTTTTTYKLRLTPAVDAVTNEVGVTGSNITGTITGPDNNSTLWAERKKL